MDINSLRMKYMNENISPKTKNESATTTTRPRENRERIRHHLFLMLLCWAGLLFGRQKNTIKLTTFHVYLFHLLMFWGKKTKKNVYLMKRKKERKSGRKGTSNSVRVREKSKVKQWRICTFYTSFWFMVFILVFCSRKYDGFAPCFSRRHLLFCEKWLLPTFADSKCDFYDVSSSDGLLGIGF